MARVRFIEHKGRQVLLADYSAPVSEEEGLAAIAECMRIAALQPPRSLLLVTDVTGATFNTRLVQALKEVAAHNGPYVRRAAVVGVSGLQKVIYQAVLRFSKRDIPAFATRQEALDWVVAETPENK
jgi:hypothetical protein